MDQLENSIKAIESSDFARQIFGESFDLNSVTNIVIKLVPSKLAVVEVTYLLNENDAEKLQDYLIIEKPPVIKVSEKDESI
jgi:hypothetical protein